MSFSQFSTVFRTRRAGIYLGIALTAAQLSGCVAFSAGGAGSMLALDRRSAEAQLADEAIEIRAVNRVDNAIGGRGHTNMVSYNKRLLITGEVPSEQDRQAALRAAQQVPNVREIFSELAIMPNSGLFERSNDTLLTSKVKSALLSQPMVPGNSIKVVSERGVVYLMGLLNPQEAEYAAAVARGVSGVKKVVRIFELVTPLIPGLKPTPGQTTAPTTRD